MKNNLGEAILIIVIVSILVINERTLNSYEILGLLSLLLLPILTWDYPAFSKERRKLLGLEIELKQARIDYLKSKTRKKL